MNFFRKTTTALFLLTVAYSPALGDPLRVVTTLPDYASIARSLAGPLATVEAIVQPEQDAHFIRPKPSFVDKVKKADMFIDTGLDLEMWVPTVINKSGNSRVRSGQPGYVAAARDMRLLEKPRVLSRSEGGLHIYGNPHINCSPINMKRAARNMTSGLIKNDPANTAVYKAKRDRVLDQIDERLFGREMVDLLGGDTLCDLAEAGKLTSFLAGQTYQDHPLSDLLGGWMKRMLPLQGTPIVTYHKNWVYFVDLFGLEEVGTVEPKPGIPPSPKHVLELIQTMKARRVRILLAANYFDEQKILTVASRAGAEPVIVPLYAEGRNGVEDYLKLVDLWVDSLLKAARKQGLIE